MTSTSISLLERLRLPGEHAAWRRFVHLYTPLIFDWARGMGLSANDAEDLVQDVMTVLVRRLPEFRYDENGSFRAWLRTITVNRCRDVYRRRGVRPHTTGDGFVDLETPDATDALVEEEYRQSLVSRALELMQNQFEAATWKACWECVVNDRPPEEVAAELGLSVNAVYVAKSRVLRRLRRDLDGLLE